ncbi:MAG: ABC transporter ATP-binding protein [Mycoplasmatales bacterium]
MAKIEFRNVGKKYDNVKGSGAREWAIRNINFTVEENEFVTFVGPSGCGKSTTLNLISGLEAISEGELVVDGQVINDFLPKDRDIAMVFQSYALYPHLTVAENIGFGLKLRNVKKAEIDQKIQEVAKDLNLENYLTVRPKDLSGGQQQRVALARALVRKPNLFLMDEPLSNLDVKLRVSTRKKIREIHDALKTVSFYVTHDQAEALTMSDKVVVMSDGKVEQIGKPREIYNYPANVFVSRFIGSVPMNIIKGKLDGNVFSGLDFSIKVEIPDGLMKKLETYNKSEVYLGFRPEYVSTDQIMKELYPNAQFKVKLNQVEFLGIDQYGYATGGWSNNIILRFAGREEVSTGDTIDVVLDMNKVKFFDIDTQETLIDTIEWK